jgi:hypothetical protein
MNRIDGIKDVERHYGEWGSAAEGCHPLLRGMVHVGFCAVEQYLARSGDRTLKLIALEGLLTPEGTPNPDLVSEIQNGRSAESLPTLSRMALSGLNIVSLANLTSRMFHGGSINESYVGDTLTVQSLGMQVPKGQQAVLGRALGSGPVTTLEARIHGPIREGSRVATELHVAAVSGTSAQSYMLTTWTNTVEKNAGARLDLVGLEGHFARPATMGFNELPELNAAIAPIINA